MRTGDYTLLPLYETLKAHYGDLRWWPARTPYEVMVGAVLTQNTAWHNVEQAIINLGDMLSPTAILKTDVVTLADKIKPSGFFQQKANYIKALTSWFSVYGFDINAVRSKPLAEVRAELLSVRGVGQETADAILLYAFGFPSFVIDAYTMRLCCRYPIYAGKKYEAVKVFFENRLPQSVDIYNHFHALIVTNGKEHCQKEPLCGECPICSQCKKRGV